MLLIFVRLNELSTYHFVHSESIKRDLTTIRTALLAGWPRWSSPPEAFILGWKLTARQRKDDDVVVVHTPILNRLERIICDAGEIAGDRLDIDPLEG